jgi:hypothetical protein
MGRLCSDVSVDKPLIAHVDTEERIDQIAQDRHQAEEGINANIAKYSRQLERWQR